MLDSPLAGLHRLVWTALMAALIAIGSLTMIPIGPVPMTLQVLFIILAGLFLGARQGAMAVGLYLLAGALGLPVFAGAKAGIAVLFGPSFGYLFAFIFLAWCAGMGVHFAKNKQRAWTFFCVGSWILLGIVVVYFCGSLGLMLKLSIPFERAVAVGTLPFILGDSIKAVIAVLAWHYMKQRHLLPR